GAVILAFDVKVEREAQELRRTVTRVKIFTADIIYHLSDAFIKWRDDRIKAEREKFKDIAVFPCKLRVLPQFIFNSRDPIVCAAVIVEAGILKVGTPISVPSKESVYLGRVEEARRGAELCIKIAAPPGDAPKMYGRHFDHNDLLMSRSAERASTLSSSTSATISGKEDWRNCLCGGKFFVVNHAVCVHVGRLDHLVRLLRGHLVAAA
uniref:IF-2 domain-containing protein n=1 Tax=Macrostomum lignano TaxID=282301 RepID=A0A1I8FQD7_9PLAT